MTNWLKKLGLGLKKSSTQLTGGLSDIFTKRKVDDATLEELEELLISADLGLKATTQIISKFAKQRLDKDAENDEIKTQLATSICNILQPCEQAFILGNSKPTVILMVGVNGAGKTTTIGKLVSKLIQSTPDASETSFSEINEDDTTERKTGVSLQKSTKKSLRAIHQISLIAGDTFRAAAVEQLQIWGDRNKVRVFKGEPNCDAAGLCFDGLQKAIELGDDIVFIDTAGRLQNKTGLMDELKKVVRVIQKVIPETPHHTLLCLDATTGQNALDQVKIFKEMVNVSGLVVNKLDGTAKGGILVAIAAENPTPIYYIGVGESIDDLDVFKAQDFANNLLGVS